MQEKIKCNDLQRLIEQTGGRQFQCIPPFQTPLVLQRLNQRLEVCLRQLCTGYSLKWRRWRRCQLRVRCLKDLTAAEQSSRSKKTRRPRCPARHLSCFALLDFAEITISRAVDGSLKQHHCRSMQSNLASYQVWSVRINNYTPYRMGTPVQVTAKNIIHSKQTA